MKIRNGFVSNSSSSSYIIAYDKELTGPEEILKYIQENPYDNMIFFGSDLNEADDIFEMEDEFKSVIRMFSKEFIESTKDGVTYYDEDFTPQKRPLKAYTGAYLRNFADAWDFDLDDKELGLTEEESALGNPSIYDDKLNFLGRPEWFTKILEERVKGAEGMKEEIEKSLEQECIQKYYKIRSEKYQLWRESKKQKKYDEIKKEGKNALYVDIDNTSCEYISDFVERYIGGENSYTYEGILPKGNKLSQRAYMLSYDSSLEDKQKIIERVSTLKDKVDENYFLFARYNKALNYVYDKPYDIKFFRLGNKEIDILLNNKEFIENDNKYVLLSNASIYFNGDTPVVRNNTEFGYGKVLALEAGSCLPDFKKLIKGDED